MTQLPAQAKKERQPNPELYNQGLRRGEAIALTGRQAWRRCRCSGSCKPTAKETTTQQPECKGERSRHRSGRDCETRGGAQNAVTGIASQATQSFRIKIRHVTMDNLRCTIFDSVVAMSRCSRCVAAIVLAISPLSCRSRTPIFRLSRQ